MSQLIALIIAIALGAIVTAIGYVFLGDAFTKNSERGVALQFVNQASQVEMSITAYRADTAGSAVDTDWATTEGELVSKGFLKDGLVAPQGAYRLEINGSDAWLTSFADATDVGNGILAVSDAVCGQVQKLATKSETLLTFNTDAKTTLDGARYGCYNNGSENVVAYEVQ